MKEKRDFRTLWGQLRDAYASAGNEKMVAVLENHSERKEAICRRLGVVCPMDVKRISDALAHG